MLMVVFAAGLWSLADAQAPKTLVVALQGDPTGLDPQTNLDNESWYIESSIYDSLGQLQAGVDRSGARARGELDDLAGRQDVHVQAAQRGDVPGRHAGDRAGGRRGP